MAHPRMYADDDPYLAELRDVCLALPEATEVEAWGRPTFRAGKIFAMFNGDDDHAYRVTFKPEPDEHPALSADAALLRPALLGSGRLAVAGLRGGAGGLDRGRRADRGLVPPGRAQAHAEGARRSAVDRRR